MREVNARLRIEGLTDADAAQLPVTIDPIFLNATEVSTWRTDFDVLVDIPGKDGARRRYEDLAVGARTIDYRGVAGRVAGLAAIVAPKEWANRPQDHKALPELRCRPPSPVPSGPPEILTPLSIHDMSLL
jgi:hypothetical protein